MFKLPSFPAGKGSKRKMPDLPSAGEWSVPSSTAHCADVLKRFKPDTDGESFSSLSDERAARVEDDDGERGPPGVSEEPEDEFDDDDEDGRFFGGGLNEEQSVRAPWIYIEC